MSGNSSVPLGGEPTSSKEYRQHMSSNVRKLQAVFFTSGLVLWYGVDKLFMQQSGYSPSQIGAAVLALQATAALAVHVVYRPHQVIFSRLFSRAWSRRLIVSRLS